MAQVTGTVSPADIAQCSRAYGLPASLIAAIVATESSGVRGAVRAEPGYRYMWDVANKKPFRELTGEELHAAEPPNGFSAIDNESIATEWWGQRMSWGPMQVMGAVARELGFLRPFGALCDAYIGLQWGCQHLLSLKTRFLDHYGWEGVVAAYNAGSPRRGDDGKWVNQGYVDTVRAHGGFKALQGDR